MLIIAAGGLPWDKIEANHGQIVKEVCTVILESATLGQAIGLRVYTMIPKYFPQHCLKEKPSFSSNSMNHFLNYLKMWGFEEMQGVGPDMGSNQNEVIFFKFEKM